MLRFESLSISISLFLAGPDTRQTTNQRVATRYLAMAKRVVELRPELPFTGVSGGGRTCKKRYLKKSKNTPKSRKKCIFRLFEYFQRLFCGPTKRPFVRLSCDFGLRGPGDSCKWRLGRNCRTLAGHFAGQLLWWANWRTVQEDENTLSKSIQACGPPRKIYSLQADTLPAPNAPPTLSDTPHSVFK